MEREETYLNRKVIEKKTFDEKGTFQSYYAAESWVHEKGYSSGSSCVMMPIALVKGEYNLPQKWKNMDDEEIKSVDGVIAGFLREGPVDVYIFN